MSAMKENNRKRVTGSICFRLNNPGKCELGKDLLDEKEGLAAQGVCVFRGVWSKRG